MSLLTSFDNANIKLTNQEEPLYQVYSKINDCLLKLMQNITANYKFKTEANDEKIYFAAMEKIKSLNDQLESTIEKNIEKDKQINLFESEIDKFSKELINKNKQFEEIKPTKEFLEKTLAENKEYLQKIEKLEEDRQISYKSMKTVIKETNQLKNFMDKNNKKDSEFEELKNKIDFILEENKNLKSKNADLKSRNINLNKILNSKKVKTNENNSSIEGNQNASGRNWLSKLRSASVSQKNNTKSGNIEIQKPDFEKQENVKNGILSIKNQKVDKITSLNQQKLKNKVKSDIFENKSFSQQSKKSNPQIKKPLLLRKLLKDVNNNIGYSDLSRDKIIQKVQSTTLPLKVAQKIDKQINNSPHPIDKKDPKPNKTETQNRQTSEKISRNTNDDFSQFSIKNIRSKFFEPNFLLELPLDSKNHPIFNEFEKKEKTKYYKKRFLEDFIQEFFHDKKDFDTNLKNSLYSSTSAEQFLYIYLKRKFGLDKIVMQFANDIVSSTINLQGKNGIAKVFFKVV